MQHCSSSILKSNPCTGRGSHHTLFEASRHLCSTCQIGITVSFLQQFGHSRTTSGCRDCMCSCPAGRGRGTSSQHQAEAERRR